MTALPSICHESTASTRNLQPLAQSIVSSTSREVVHRFQGKQSTITGSTTPFAPFTESVDQSRGNDKGKLPRDPRPDDTHNSHNGIPETDPQNPILMAPMPNKRPAINDGDKSGGIRVPEYASAKVKEGHRPRVHSPTPSCNRPAPPHGILKNSNQNTVESPRPDTQTGNDGSVAPSGERRAITEDIDESPYDIINYQPALPLSGPIFQGQTLQGKVEISLDHAIPVVALDGPALSRKALHHRVHATNLESDRRTIAADHANWNMLLPMGRHHEYGFH